MTFQILTKNQMNEKKITLPLSGFIKNSDGKPFCFGEFGKYQGKKNCSDCKYKKECLKKWNEEYDKN